MMIIIIILTPMMISMEDMGVKKHAHQIVIIIIIFKTKQKNIVIVIITQSSSLSLTLCFCFFVLFLLMKMILLSSNNNLCHNRSIYQQQCVIYGFFEGDFLVFLVENSISSFFCTQKKILFTIAPDIILILLWRQKKKISIRSIS